MIKLGIMRWSNALSYGENNYIDFSKDKLLQLIGKNGHGKSSIAILLEEVLYNKNSKGIKKGDILNRFVKASTYTIELEFEKDGIHYKIHTVRSATQTIKLFKNGEDISAHTATATYKLIEEIIGFDHKTFTQIVYQSSAANLEFLTATDGNRKKFLIDLLNLSIYTKAADLFKTLSKDVNNQYETINLKTKTIKDWLSKFSKEDLIKKSLLLVPEPATDQVNQLSLVQEKLRNIELTNKKIVQNNKYKELLNSIPLVEVSAPIEDITTLKVNHAEIRKQIASLERTIAGTGPLTDTCPACGQKLDNTHKLQIVTEAENKLPLLKEKEVILQKEINKYTVDKARYDSALSNKTEWEKYYSLFDKTLSKNLLDRQELEQEYLSLQKIISDRTTEISTTQKHNSEIVAHNTKVDVIISQMESMTKDLCKFTSEETLLQSKLNTLQLLVKTFSATGLVAYKIECLVKDLEELTNNYLLDMSDGRFQLSFKVNSSDKLNVVINDNGKDIDILALSSGERSRVNVSTLLAIRKLMQSLSNSRINLLILDETIESLDLEGKERLIEVLLKEEHLNTILVSHSFNHPLIEKLNIIKENNISRIE